VVICRKAVQASGSITLKIKFDIPVSIRSVVGFGTGLASPELSVLLPAVLGDLFYF
jgi:hypothetical protein